MNNLDQKEWVALMEETPDAILLDVRTEEEYESGYIKGAQLIDIRQPQEFMDAIQAIGQRQILFCLLSFWCSKRTSLPAIRTIRNCFGL